MIGEQNPDEWHIPFAKDLVGLNPTYPIDGRPTLWEPYESFANTSTAGGYMDALERLQGRDPSLPLDFGAYLAQRVPSAAHMASLDPMTPIDRYGAGPK
jgi:hypothetical protein